jgi:hypothetical protein
LDVSYCEFNGVQVAWIPPKGFSGPWYYELSDDYSFLKYGLAGLFNTCGLISIGNPATIATDHYGFAVRPSDRHGIHDRISVTPATHVAFGETWEGDECTLWAEGIVHQHVAYGENLVLKRRYEVALGGRNIRIIDTVTNEGFYPTPHQLMYHFNIGFPVVDDGAELLAPVVGEVPDLMLSVFEKDSVGRGDRYRKYSDPQPAFGHEAYMLPLVPDEGDTVHVAVVNRGFQPTDGLGVSLAYSHKMLPEYVDWRQMAEGLYAVGIEPATNPFGNIPELIERGYPLMLEPAEARTYELDFGIVIGQEEIDEFEQRVTRAQEAAVA